MGGKPICELGLGDDEDNIENDFLVWKKQFRPLVCKEFGLSGEASAPSLHFKQKMVVLSEEEKGKLRIDPTLLDRWRTPKTVQTEADAKKPILASIRTCRELYSPVAGRSCMHVEIEANSALSYKAGKFGLRILN